MQNTFISTSGRPSFKLLEHRLLQIGAKGDATYEDNQFIHERLRIDLRHRD